MRNVAMIRPEPGLVSIPLEKAVYCDGCRMISSSTRRRCGLCGSERMVGLATLFAGPPDPWPPPPTSFASALKFAA
jgi:hypothetical protein